MLAFGFHIVGDLGFHKLQNFPQALSEEITESILILSPTTARNFVSQSRVKSGV